LRCEICGRKIVGEPHVRVVEGVKLIVCDKCALHGESYWEPIQKTSVKTTLKPALKPKVRKPTINEEYLKLELVEDYPEKVRKARVKMGLTQEELAKKLKEKLSVIQKIEIGKIAPPINLARALEHLLKIKILTLPSHQSERLKLQPERRELTLGDLARVKYKRVKGAK